MARIFRDAWGVPHVRATSLADLARGQGEVTARDRAWQLEFLRRRATGTTAEVFGPSGLPWDRLARRTGIAATARRAHARLSAETQAFVAAYVDGVNDGLHADAPELLALDLAPTPWEEWTPLAVFHAQHLLFASLPGKLWSARAGRGARRRRRSPLARGAAAEREQRVGGRRRAHGERLPADRGRPAPHDREPRASTSRSGWRATSSTSPGSRSRACPASSTSPTRATSRGRSRTRWPTTRTCTPSGCGARATAWRRWGRTAGNTRRSRSRPIPVLGADPEDLEMVTTARGPVFSGSVDEGSGLSLRAASSVLGDLGFDAILPLLRRAPSTTWTPRSTPGSSRSTTSSSPTGTAPSATASPAGSRSATTTTGRASPTRPTRGPAGPDGSTRCRAPTYHRTGRW